MKSAKNTSVLVRKNNDRMIQASKATMAKQRRRLKMFDTEEEQRHAFLSGEATFWRHCGVVVDDRFRHVVAFAIELRRKHRSNVDVLCCGTLRSRSAQRFERIVLGNDHHVDIQFAPSSCLVCRSPPAMKLSPAMWTTGRKNVGWHVRQYGEPFYVLRVAYFSLICFSIPFASICFIGLVLFIVSCFIVVLNDFCQRDGQSYKLGSCDKHRRQW